jgi:hypothetical protein
MANGGYELHLVLFDDTVSILLRKGLWIYK